MEVETQFRPSFLAGILLRPTGGRLAAEAGGREYASALNSTMTVRGITTTRSSVVRYHTSPTQGELRDKLDLAPEGARRLVAEYQTSGEMVAHFSNLARKYVNFSANFEASNLAGLVERISLGLSLAAWHDNVTAFSLRGGREPDIAALGATTTPVNSVADCVFIPRVVNTVITGDIFSVLVAAATGCGAAVATDMLGVNDNGVALLNDVDARRFPPAAVEALRLLGANMNDAGQGALFALALTRGLHKGTVVQSTTRGGALTRAFLIAGTFSVPFGGINPTPEPYAALPALNSSDGVAVGGYVDGLCLATAAAVAHCDPGTTIEGLWYPTTYVTPRHDAFGVAGSVPTADPLNGASLWPQIISESGRFLGEYVSALGRLFSAEDGLGLANRAACTMAHLALVDDWGCDDATVAPYFWIEPTSILPQNWLGSAAERSMSGALVTPGGEVTLPAVEGVQPVGDSTGPWAGYVLELSSARRNPLFIHFGGQMSEHLGTIVPRQLDVETVVHPKLRAEQAALRDRLQASLGLDQYVHLPERMPIPSPDNFMHVGCRMGVEVVHEQFVNYRMYPSMLPAAHEFAHSTVTLSVTKPFGVPAGAAPEIECGFSHEPTRTALMLSQTSHNLRGPSSVAFTGMLISTSAPAAPRYTSGQGRSRRVALGDERHEVGSAGVDHNPSPPVPVGNRLGVTTHHDAGRGPAPIRRADQVRGGGGGAPQRRRDDGQAQDPVAPPPAHGEPAPPEVDEP
ncbi:coat protein [Botryosphaeria dothidea victorivirus 1]|uniref:Coat protein n=1 Tax=Botryosphaeria dothidea victorivirus 1 TaxID=1547580 RepID=A0A089H6F5_9VIRU|nr:coat protein [Botryosphaeria dothidea victorivirus 1]AIP92360.1 coat protein [Botryosphaeria dothidea victorivirus 1]